MLQTKSEPYFSRFDPSVIPYQWQVIHDIYKVFDYSLGVHEILLSGSVGSAKSILMAHIVVKHCLMNQGARVCLGRKALPDLKATIYKEIKDHIEKDLVENEDYVVNDTTATIRFLKTGSEIISRSWSDKRFRKGRSLKLSMLVIEELTENNEDDKEAYDELRMRVGRIPHIKQNLVLCATNPDAPSHWAYDYFINTKFQTRHVYYSVTTDNPFLPSWYIDQLENELDPQIARRMIHGEWIEISKEVIYHAYSKTKNYKDESFEVIEYVPIDISFDFNIGEGKPMSCCVAQYYKDHFHFFNECVVEGARTEDILEELADRGLLDYDNDYRVFGDATGKSRDTRSKKSDYDIIRKFLANHRTKNGNNLNFEMCVPASNPSVRTRHNRVNGYCKNTKGKHRLTVYKDAPTLDKGFRLTSLKKGGQYIEDDSKPYQHITTAAGYYIMKVIKDLNKGQHGGQQIR